MSMFKSRHFFPKNCGKKTAAQLKTKVLLTEGRSYKGNIPVLLDALKILHCLEKKIKELLLPEIYPHFEEKSRK